jgi:hypothetical protein
MDHAPITADEAPFSVYLADAKAQVAKSRAAGLLEHLPYYDAQMARTLALLNRDADRQDAYRSRKATHTEAQAHRELGRAA